jgi:hypothetical protein
MINKFFYGQGDAHQINTQNPHFIYTHLQQLSVNKVTEVKAERTNKTCLYGHRDVQKLNV